MNLNFFLVAAYAVSIVAARRSCGSSPPTEDDYRIAQNLRLPNSRPLRPTSNSSDDSSVEIGVYWHVIAYAKNIEAGYLSQQALDGQLAVLNSAYAPHNISFVQAGVDWSINAAWSADRAELSMKQALRRGTYADLNVYFVTECQYLGYATSPQATRPGSREFNLDGVVMLWNTVPGGSFAPYNLGHTATHEIGHWLGLQHTFQGDSCSGDGDFVDDTPFESEASFGCEIGRDTCPDAPGNDSVTNYMNYSDDRCFDHFTAGQEARFYLYWNTYRARYQNNTKSYRRAGNI